MFRKRESATPRRQREGHARRRERDAEGGERSFARGRARRRRRRSAKRTHGRKITQIYEGTNEIQRVVVAGALLKGEAI